MSDNQKLVFHKRDFLYDNGLVNFVLYLCEITGQQPVTGQDVDKFTYTFGKSTNVTLNKDFLEIEGSKDEINNLFNEIRKKILDKYLSETENYRIWWDKEKKEFTCNKKVKSESEQIVNIMNTEAISIKETEFSFEELKKMEKLAVAKFKEEYGKLFSYEEGKVFADQNKKIYCHFDIDKLKKKKLDFYLQGKDDILKRKKTCAHCNNNIIASFLTDSYSYFYENGGDSFTDLRKGTKEYVCPYCFLINNISKKFSYYYAFNIDRKNKRNYFFYFDAVNLTDLIVIKCFLSINNENIEVEDKKTKVKREIPTNIDQSNFYIKGIGLYTKVVTLIWNIYQKIKDSKNDNEYIDLEGIRRYILHVIEDDGTFVTGYKKVTRLDKMFLFFDNLHKNKVDQIFKKLLININMVNSDDKGQTLLNEFSKNIINFEKKLMDTIDQNGQNALKANTGGTPDLDKFISLFQDEINATDKEKMLHNISSQIGKRIGRIAYITESKDILYRIREIGSIRGFATFFEEFSHRVLKYDGKEGVSINKEFKEREESFLKALSPTNWKEARGYISIYAINNYLSNKAYKENKSKESN
jgi:hypothetical protein